MCKGMFKLFIKLILKKESIQLQLYMRKSFLEEKSIHIKIFSTELIKYTYVET